MRGDVLTYDVLNNCAAQTVAHPSTTNPPIDQSCLTQQDLGRPREPNQQTSTSSMALLPRASLLLGPLQGFTLSGSYGQGIRSIDPSYITQDVKTPFASIVAYEGGVAYAGQLRDAVDRRPLDLLPDGRRQGSHLQRDRGPQRPRRRARTRTGWVGAAARRPAPSSTSPRT